MSECSQSRAQADSLQTLQTYPFPSCSPPKTASSPGGDRKAPAAPIRAEKAGSPALTLCHQPAPWFSHKCRSQARPRNPGSQRHGPRVWDEGDKMVKRKRPRYGPGDIQKKKKQIQDSKVERETEKERMFKETFRKKGTSKETKERNRRHKGESQGRQGGKDRQKRTC